MFAVAAIAGMSEEVTSIAVAVTTTVKIFASFFITTSQVREGWCCGVACLAF